MRQALAAVFLALSILVVYSASFLGGSFLWDDEQFIVKNAHVQSGNVAQLFHEDLVAGAGGVSNFYRPFQALTHMADYYCYGLDPMWHRITSVLLLALAGIALLAVNRRMHNSLLLSFLVTLLFMLHPLLVFTGGYISGRGDTLVLLFLCISYLLLDTSYVGALVAGVLALCSKETAVMWPAFLACAQLAEGRRLGWKKLFMPAAISGGYVVLRLTVLNFKNTLNFYDSENPLTAHVVYRIATYVSTLPQSLKIWFWPTDLHHERFLPLQVNLLEPQVLLGFLVLGLFLGTFFYAKSIRGGALWYILATLPTSNCIAVINALFFDHWFIVPGVGLCWMCLGAARYVRVAQVVVGGALIAVLPFTMDQQHVWREPRALFERILQFEPNNGRALNNLAMNMADDESEEAERLLLRALQSGVPFHHMHHNLGMIYLKRKQFEVAIASFQRSVALEPRAYYSYTKLAVCLLELRRYSEAQSNVDLSMAIFPTDEAQELGAQIERSLL